MGATEAGHSQGTRGNPVSAPGRRLGTVMAGVLALFGGVAWWRGRAAGPYLLGSAGLVLAVAMLLPRAVAVVEKLLRPVARMLALVITQVVLTLVYFIVVTPVGMVARIVGRDRLRLGRSAGDTSYWTVVEDDVNARLDRPF